MFYHQLCFFQCMWPESLEHGSVMCLAQLQGELLSAFETTCVEVARARAGLVSKPDTRQDGIFS